MAQPKLILHREVKPTAEPPPELPRCNVCGDAACFGDSGQHYCSDCAPPTFRSFRLYSEGKGIPFDE